MGGRQIGTGPQLRVEYTVHECRAGRYQQHVVHRRLVQVSVALDGVVEHADPRFVDGSSDYRAAVRSAAGHLCCIGVPHVRLQYDEPVGGVASHRGGGHRFGDPVLHRRRTGRVGELPVDLGHQGHRQLPGWIAAVRNDRRSGDLQLGLVGRANRRRIRQIRAEPERRSFPGYVRGWGLCGLAAGRRFRELGRIGQQPARLAHRQRRQHDEGGRPVVGRLHGVRRYPV